MCRRLPRFFIVLISLSPTHTSTSSSVTAQKFPRQMREQSRHLYVRWLTRSVSLLSMLIIVSEGLHRMNAIELSVAHDPHETKACVRVTFWRQDSLGPVQETQPPPRIVLKVVTRGDSLPWFAVVTEIFRHLAPCQFLFLSVRFHPNRCLSCRCRTPHPQSNILTNRDAVSLFQLPVFGRAPLFLDDRTHQTWLARRVSLGP